MRIIFVLQIARELNMKRVPSAFQIRYGGCKGMIAKDPTIRGDKLITRTSMEKFESTHEGIEVMNYSKPCKTMKLFKPYILECSNLLR